jgi:hypothetical protein
MSGALAALQHGTQDIVSYVLRRLDSGRDSGIFGEASRNFSS